MSLRIRCPHCHYVLVVRDELAGRSDSCPKCGRTFNVPMPSSASAPARAVGVTKCPRCGMEASPTAEYCHKCHRDLKTGRPLPLRRRLGLVRWHAWAIGAAVAAVIGVGVFAGAELYRIRAAPPKTPLTPITSRPIPAAELAGRLLGAQTAAQRRAALEALAGVEGPAAPAIAAALEASLEQGASDPQTRGNRLAAVDVLARGRAAGRPALPEWIALLERCQRDAALHEAALRARALLGDGRVLDDLSGLWLERAHCLVFLSRIVQITHAEQQPGARLALGRARDELTRCADGLRVLAQDENCPLFERLADAWWTSWDWLGQGRGDRLADEIFELAAPPDSTLKFRPEDVRRPRDVLRRVGERGTPSARAAAGLILELRGPQYTSVCREISAKLAVLLTDGDALEQQRLTWTIARLEGKLFGNISQNGPLEVTEREIGAALEWARPGQPPALKGPYATPPVLVYRAVPAQRLLERDLLRAVRGDWAAVHLVADRWRAADLGCTPGLRELLDPGQRRPDEPGLAAAMIIVAETGDESLRPKLEMWREAGDQPAWVRALAYTVLGSLDARRNRWDSGWPAGLDLGATSVLESGRPGWDHFGRVAAAGGPGLLRRLTDLKLAGPPGTAQAKLVEATKRAAQRGAPPGAP
jgi:hypothetical protein